MKTFISLILSIILFSSANADIKLSVSPYVANIKDSSGMIINLSNDSNFLWKADINLSRNFAGPSVAFGIPIGDLKVYLGYHDIIRMEQQSGFVDIQGVPIFDPSSDAQGSGIYVEAVYKNLFVRYLSYDVDYILRSHRDVIVRGKLTRISNSMIVPITGEVVWVGFAFAFE